MIRRLLLAAVVAFAPMGPTLAPAVAATPAATLDSDLAAITRYAAAPQQALAEVAGVITTAVQGMQIALQYSLSPRSKDKARAWGEAWEADLRQKIAALKAWRTRLPPAPTAALSRQTPEFRSMYERMPARVDTMVAVTVEFAERMIEPTRKAAEGDDAATKLVSTEFFRGSGLMIRAENEIMDLSISGLPDENPGKQLSQSIYASNEGIGMFLDYLAAISQASEVDRVKMSADIRAKAKRSDERARACIARAKATKTLISATADPNKPRYLAAMTTYEDSCAVEIEVAAVVASLAEPVDKGVLFTGPAQEKMAGLQPLVQKRLDLQTQRIRLLEGR